MSNNMPLPEKKDRNLQIYLDKEGLVWFNHTKRLRKPLSYRQLIKKYDLSLNMLQRIVKRYRKKYAKYYKKLPPLVK